MFSRETRGKSKLPSQFTHVHWIILMLKHQSFMHKGEKKKHVTNTSSRTEANQPSDVALTPETRLWLLNVAKWSPQHHSQTHTHRYKAVHALIRTRPITHAIPNYSLHFKLYEKDNRRLVADIERIHIFCSNLGKHNLPKV